jgi:hypothetical protein
MNVTNCPANGGPYTSPYAANLTPVGRVQAVAMGLVNGVARVAKSLFVPKEVYAIDIGGGGFADFFSTFGVVDPFSKPDLAQSPSAYFAATKTDLQVGDKVPVQAWSVTNLGSGTSGAFSSEVIIANDAALTSRVVTYSLDGASSLVPRASFSYPAQSFSMPAAPGTYYVGTRVVYAAGTDSTASDDWKSTRVVVNAVGGPTGPSCEAIRLAHHGLHDGDYTIQSGTRSYTVYCVEMLEGPAREYLTLLATGPGKNFASWAGEYQQPLDARLLTTTYTRVRINPLSLKVATTDVSFAMSTAPVFGPGQMLYSYNFASAGDCLSDGSQQGKANVDLTGTPFRITDSFRVDGWNPAGTVNGVSVGWGGTLYVQSQVLNTTGGGFCGGTTPMQPDSLQLEFMPSLTHGNSLMPRRP